MLAKTYVPEGEELAASASQIGTTIEALAATIAARRNAGEESYTHRLLTASPDAVLKKVMEEAGEVALAAKDVESWATSSLAAALVCTPTEDERSAGVDNGLPTGEEKMAKGEDRPEAVGKHEHRVGRVQMVKGEDCPEAVGAEFPPAPSGNLQVNLPAEYSAAVDHLRYEAADVVYHLLVVLERYGISTDEFAAELNERMIEVERPAGAIRLREGFVQRGK